MNQQNYFNASLTTRVILQCHVIEMDPTAGYGDPNGAQYYGLEQSYGSDQLYGAESSGYGDTSSKLAGMYKGFVSHVWLLV